MNWINEIRVLVVEDFKPFRQFIRKTLATRPGLQIVDEASDGPEAVQKAEELKPELVPLDNGLPTLHGLHAARQIRKLIPESKIIFVSHESDIHKNYLRFQLFRFLDRFR